MDMRDILQRFDESVGKEQKKVNQLDADFKPKTTAVLKSKRDPKNPMGGKLVGSCEESRVAEDMLGTVRRGLDDYIKALDSEPKSTNDILPRSLDTRDIGSPYRGGPSFVPRSAPVVVQAPPVKALIKAVSIDDVNECEIWGDEGNGFEIRRGDRTLPTKFNKLDHAEAAIDAWLALRNRPLGDSMDYAEEK